MEDLNGCSLWRNLMVTSQGINGHSLWRDLKPPLIFHFRFTKSIIKTLTNVVQWQNTSEHVKVVAGSSPAIRLRIMVRQPSGKASDCKSLMRWFKSNPNLSFNNKLIMYVADTLGRKPLHNEVMPIRKYPLLGGTYRRAIDCNLSNGQVRFPECISVIIIEQC